MSSIFFLLAVISGGVAVGGYVWSVTVGLRSRREATLAAEKAQKGMISGTDHATTTDAAVVAPIGGNSAEEWIGFSFAAVGCQIRKGGWRRALPGLLAAGGMLSLLIFGALALLTSLPSKLFGLAALSIAAYISVSELRSLIRAARD